MRRQTKTPYLAMLVPVGALMLVAHHGCGGNEETSACEAGKTECAGACVDTRTNSAHCGTCNNECAVGSECVAGSCACPSGEHSCFGSCVNTVTDVSNCGSCANRCAEIETCVNGSCECPGGQTFCDPDCSDTKVDKMHCGTCTTVCAPAQSCSNGQCQCSGGKELCAGECVDTDANSHYCGDCNTACGDNQFCQGGTCQNISNCGAVPIDGYEPNDTCETAKVLPDAAESAPEDPAVTVGDATLHHTDATLDTDWYTVYAHEATHVCWPGNPQCSFFFDIAFTPPEGADHTSYQLCVSIGACGAPDAEFCTAETDWIAQDNRYVMSLTWQGSCGSSDSWTFYIKIARSGGQESCKQYALDYKFYYADQECPSN